MTRKLKKRLYKILIGAVLFAVAMWMDHACKVNFPNLLLYLAAYGVIGGDVVKKAVRNIAGGQIFDENFLMLIATVGAFLVGEYHEAVVVMLFYQVGEWFQSYAVGRSRKSIRELMDIRPDFARVLREGGENTVEPEEVKAGECILVRPGERIPLDGTVLEGSSSLDTKALTGESLPRDVMKGSEVISGCINGQGMLMIQVTKEFSQSTVSKILELVENAASQKAVTERFISRFARYYTPVVVILAVILAVLPPLIITLASAIQLLPPEADAAPGMWLYRALTFLVISCPCALVISVPLSFFGGLGGAGKAGILIKGSNFLEILSGADTIVCDKTGTLTKGNFAVTKTVAVGQNMSEEKLLLLSAYAECYSNHPIAVALREACKTPVDPDRVAQVEELPGYGVRAVLKNDGWEVALGDIWDGAAGTVPEILVGNETLMTQQGVAVEPGDSAGTVCHVAAGTQGGTADKVYLGYIVIEDQIKEEAAAAIEEWKAEGIKRIVMLTGDREEAAKEVAQKLGISEYRARLLPDQKVEAMEKLLEETEGKLIFVGDGMNDAPVLARVDIGIAMGGLGCDAAIEAADIVIMNDRLSKIAQALRISRKTLVIVKENIVFAIGVKVAVLGLAALGMASMWAAVFADVGVAFLAILNAMRAMHVSEGKKKG
ncbi:MAG: heavy metal translocating P-type ATPase [Lachnospiraceae bacterium]|nr:heavy metal translocating P-type ATPase [Lachnospiraceae bacterium]